MYIHHNLQKNILGLQNSRTVITKRLTQLFLLQPPPPKKKIIKIYQWFLLWNGPLQMCNSKKHWLLLVGLTKASFPICAWWKTLPSDINGIKLILSHLRGLLLIFPGFCQGKSVFSVSLWITQRKSYLLFVEVEWIQLKW